MVNAGEWQAARSLGEWSLVGCDVGPGFDFEDFSFVASHRRTRGRLHGRTRALYQPALTGKVHACRGRQRARDRMDHLPLLLVGCHLAATATGRPTAATPARRGIPRSTQINRGNVGDLALAWSYDTGEKGDTQTQPIVVGRVMYGIRRRTRPSRSMRRPANTWIFDSGIAGVGANRGLMYWRDGREARVFAAVDNFVYALDAATGKPIAASASRAASTCAKTSAATRRPSRCG